MSYEVRDGVMWEIQPFGRPDGLTYDHNRGPIGRAVADALDVLRAAGWTVETWTDPAEGTERLELQSPWRKVDGADDDQ